MAVYTYDEEADVLYVLLAADEDPDIARTVELTETLHVDVNDDEQVVGVEILHPTRGGIDLGPLKERYGVELKLPFDFAA